MQAMGETTEMAGLLLKWLLPKDLPLGPLACLHLRTSTMPPPTWPWPLHIRSSRLDGREGLELTEGEAAVEDVAVLQAAFQHKTTTGRPAPRFRSLMCPRS